MKKHLQKSLLALLLIPVLIFGGCGKKKLPAISISRYFQDTLTISRFGISETSTESVSMLTASKPNAQNLSKYTKFEFTATPNWIYKMYIEYISFYVYASEDSQYQMVVNLKMTDLATEQAIMSATTETVETETYEQQCNITPKKNKAIKCIFNINRTVISALGANVSIDILNSLELFAGEEDSNTFTWLIYGLEIHGESRAYTR